MHRLSSQSKSPATDDATLLRRLSENLARWAFTDFEQAKYALDELKGLITARSPFDIRLSYHRSAAFLENRLRFDFITFLIIKILGTLCD